MFVPYTALVGLDYFAKLHLSFLLVIHTHEDVDKRFNVVFGTLKQQDINLMQELLDLVKKGISHIEAFTTWWYLKNIWN